MLFHLMSMSESQQFSNWTIKQLGEQLGIIHQICFYFLCTGCIKKTSRIQNCFQIQYFTKLWIVKATNGIYGT